MSHNAKNNHSLEIRVATRKDIRFAEEVCLMLERSAQSRGTGIARRSPEYIRNKIREGKAVIAVRGDTLAGFCYIETWEHGKYVANSGLIVSESFRGTGVGKRIKEAVFRLSRKMFPRAKIFSITTSAAVLRINSKLGYRPVSFAQLTDEDEFWEGCKTCVNYDVLKRTERQLCLCTGMLFDPHEETDLKKKESHHEKKESRISL